MFKLSITRPFPVAEPCEDCAANSWDLPSRAIIRSNKIAKMYEKRFERFMVVPIVGNFRNFKRCDKENLNQCVIVNNSLGYSGVEQLASELRVPLAGACGCHS